MARRPNSSAGLTLGCALVGIVDIAGSVCRELRGAASAGAGEKWKGVTR